MSFKWWFFFFFFFVWWISLFHSSFQFSEKSSLSSPQEKSQFRKNWFDTSNDIINFAFLTPLICASAYRYIERQWSSFGVVCQTVLLWAMLCHDMKTHCIIFDTSQKYALSAIFLETNHWYEKDVGKETIWQSFGIFWKF